jgi:vacuolar-type H+-ATPase subunit E/Vma4
MFALPLLAASTSGWELVRADYGSGNNWTDVTERVRSLVRGDALRFRVNAAALGEDYRRGRNRVLRLQLRDSNGQSRQVRYRENQQVNLHVFATYQTDLRIDRATYGAGDRNSDVTARLNSQIRNGQLNLRVDNNTMGGDPAPSQSKTLTVQYSQDGRANRVVIREGDTLRLFGTNGRYGTLRIDRATYGAGHNNSDVTARLNSQIRNGQLNLRVDNNTMGGDPAPNQSKTLAVQYTINGQASQVEINEGDRLRLNNDAGQERLQITRAAYGAGDRWADVTPRLNSQIEGNQLHLLVNNDTMGGDPAQNQRKTLRVDYTFDGRASQVVVIEGGTLRLNSRSDHGTLHIDRATYGSGFRSSDVTTRLNSQIQGNQLNLRVDNNTMGGDPAPNQSKTLTVQYTINGQPSRVQTNEGDTLQLGFGETNGYSTLHIDRATYGSGFRSFDVTTRLNSQIRNEQLNLRVDNDTMGGDPALNQSKSLRVDYTLDGRTSQIVISEGDMLRLGYGENTGYGTLRIDRATYGSGFRTTDVTSRLNSQIRGNQLNLRVDNDTMGGDPAPSQSKALRVEYSFDGRREEVTVNEGDVLRLSYGNSSGLSQRVRCESQSSDRRTYCSADTRGGIRLSRRLSDSECVQGSSWGYDATRVWVDRGCRADFELGNGGYAGSGIATTIPNGTELSVRTNESIDSKTATAGQTYSAVVNSDVLDGFGKVTIPRGSDAELVIRSADGGGITSASELVLDVTSVTVSGTRYLVSTGDLEREGGQGVGANKKTAIMVGGGAAIGTLIGAIAGGAKGAAIGAAIGAGAGLGTQVLTRGKEVRVPAETLLTFRLDQDLRLQSLR